MQWCWYKLPGAKRQWRGTTGVHEKRWRGRETWYRALREGGESVYTGGQLAEEGTGSGIEGWVSVVGWAAQLSERSGQKYTGSWCC